MYTNIYVFILVQTLRCVEALPLLPSAYVLLCNRVALLQSVPQSHLRCLQQSRVYTLSLLSSSMAFKSAIVQSCCWAVVAMRSHLSAFSAFRAVLTLKRKMLRGLLHHSDED